jgi:DNA-binding NtrC family response regulator
LLIVDYTLNRLARKYGVSKRLSEAALASLERREWPGNVRQLVSVITAAYGMAASEIIELDDFESFVDPAARAIDAEDVHVLFSRLTVAGQTFWDAIGDPFLNRDLNRAQVRAVVRRGLAAASHNYRQLLDLFNMPSSENSASWISAITT